MSNDRVLGIIRDLTATKRKDGTGHPNVDLSKLLTFRLSRLQARANSHAAKILKQHAGISLSEWRVFVLIETFGKTTSAQIVRSTKFDKGQVSRTIKGMQQKGLLNIESSKTDQRSYEIDFSAKGLSLFEKARPAMRRRQDILMQSLGPEDREQLFRIFDKLDAALVEMEAAI